MSDAINHGRRGFLRGRVAARPPRRPPWALPEGGFLDACTRCADCVPACPTSIVVMREGYPQVDFSRGACTFCAACVVACRPAALRRDEGAPPWQARAHVLDACFAMRGVECRICGDHCEAQAIRFSPRLGGPPRPEILDDRCTGCGACVRPCPVAALRVD